MKLPSKINWVPLLSIIIFLTSLTGTYFLLVYDFDGIEFNGDSHVYFLNAQHLAEAVSSKSLPKPTYWPYGYPALVSAAITIGDATFESARWVNIILGGLLALSFCSTGLLIARYKKFSDADTLLLVVFIGLFPLGHSFFLKYQLDIMSDMLAMLLSLLTLFFCWRWRISDRMRDIVLAGLFLGLSVFTRYVNALLLFPVLVILLSGMNFRETDLLRKHFIAIFIMGIIALLVFAPQLYITLQDTSSSLGNKLIANWSIRNFFTITHESADGHQPAILPSILYYFSLPFRLDCFTPLGIPLAYLGLLYSIRELPKWLWLSLISWYLLFYLLLCGFPLQNGRIGFPLFFPILIWISVGIIEFKIRWINNFPKIVIVSILVWVSSLIFSFQTIHKFIQNKNNLKETAGFVEQYTSPGSKIISTSLCAVYKAYPCSIEPISIYTISREETEKLFSSNKPVFLAIEEEPFKKQWGNYPPGKVLNLLKKNYNCLLKGNVNGFNVYEVKHLDN